MLTESWMLMSFNKGCHIFCHPFHLSSNRFRPPPPPPPRYTAPKRSHSNQIKNSVWIKSLTKASLGGADSNRPAFLSKFRDYLLTISAIIMRS